jgi:hypothetical protein
MSFLARFRKPKEDPEVVRRSTLLRVGRIGEATVEGVDTDDAGNVMLTYNYTVGGVDYQAFQRLDEQQRLRKYDFLPGARVPLRYDPRRPANSFVA